jgi:PAS domain S-box-containing protein
MGMSRESPVAGEGSEAESLLDALRASEERLRIGAEVAGFGTYDLDIATGVAVWSPEMYRIMGVPLGQPVEMDSVMHIVHPEERERVLAILSSAFDPAGPGEAEAEFRVVHTDGSTRWLYGRGRTFFEGEGKDRRAVRYVGAIQDITGHKQDQERLRENEARLRLAFTAGSLGDWSWDLASDLLTLSPQAAALFGVDGEYVTWAEMKSLMDEEDAQRTQAAGIATITKGVDYQAEYRLRRTDGTSVWIYAVGKPVAGADGRRTGIVGAVQDVTGRRRAEDALREESRTLETLNRTGAALAAELDLERLVQMVTDAGVELTGAAFGAFFYNVLNEAGERLLLYTLSGAPREHFEQFGMPRATAVFHPTFVGEGTIRADDIQLDPRYGRSEPHFGMPKGHLPVRSYLAVPVISRSGEVIGGLFFGHPEPKRFTERHERLITGIAAQAAVGIDNARLLQSAQREVAERMRAEAELRHLNETLEQRVIEEIERRTAVEEALRQAQKMETLGQLTGGVAHDFNNLLQIVTGNLELLQRSLPEGEGRLRRAAENAAKGAERAAVLTQRLLAFSRRQPLAPKTLDPNRLIAGMSELLHRTLGETVEVEAVRASGLWQVEVDPNQLENAILNLAVNARDAMPGGGKLTIETANTHLDRAYVANNAEVAPGQYVVLCVSDTGAGMDEETLNRAFEPFFTTKEVGKGTGLGLSMVYGFVKQSGGHLKIYSEPGEGTTVKIYLPRMMAADAAEEEKGDEPIVPEGAREEIILVCEDDEDVRAYSIEVLRELGYGVLEAADGHAALALLKQPGLRVDLLFTDVVLPGGMTGAVLADEARVLRPGLKVLFTTGYARNAIVHHGRLDPGVELITKPFSYSDLAMRIRDLLDGTGASRVPGK